MLSQSDAGRKFQTNGRVIYIDAIRLRGTFSPSKWHHHRSGCRHGSSILRAYYVKVRSWNATRHDSFLRRLSPLFRTNTLKAPPTLHRNRGLWEARSVLPAPLYHPRALAIRFETREIILLLHLARRSSSLPFFSRPFWPHRQVWIETLRVIIPGLQYGRRRLNLSFSLLLLFRLHEHVSRNFSTRHSRDVLARRCLLSFKPLSFYLSQIITLAKMVRDVLLSHACLNSRFVTSRHVTSCPITSCHGKQWQYRPHYTNWRDIFFSINHIKLKIHRYL